MDTKWLEEIEKHGERSKLPSETVLLNPGDYIRYLPILVNGVIRVTQEDAEGKEILLYYIRAGESCIMSFLGELHHVQSQVKATVEEDCEVILIPADEARRLLQSNPRWVDFLFTLFHKRFDDLLSVVNAIAFQKVDQRLLDLLRKKAELHHAKELNVTHQQIADELGTAREVVSRLLKQLERDNKIELGRNKIKILSLV